MKYIPRYEKLGESIDLFRGLLPKELGKLFSLGLVEEVPEGKVIFNKGDIGNKMYAIIEGVVQITDEDAILATLSDGDTFGEMALLSPSERSATAVTKEHSTLFALTKETLENLLTKQVSIKLMLNIIDTLCRRLRDADEALAARLY